MQQIRTEAIAFTKTEPASRWNIFLYLITAGRKGKVFQLKPAEMTRYHAEMDSRVNCRCVARPLRKED